MEKHSKLQELQFDFARHIRDPEHAPAPDDVEDRRMGIYRDLFFNNIKGLLANNFPVIHKLYSDDRWNEIVRDFFVRHRARTPMFPELAREFLQFVEDHRGPETGDPAFLLELAHYEWVELALSLDSHELDEVICDPDGDLIGQAPVLSPLAWLLIYQFPVHQIRQDFRPKEPPPQPSYLVVYRDESDTVRFMELNAVTARLVELIRDQPEITGHDHLQKIAAELSADPESIRTHGASVLADLRVRGIVRGTKRDKG